MCVLYATCLARPMVSSAFDDIQNMVSIPMPFGPTLVGSTPTRAHFCSDLRGSGAALSWSIARSWSIALSLSIELSWNLVRSWLFDAGGGQCLRSA